MWGRGTQQTRAREFRQRARRGSILEAGWVRRMRHARARLAVIVGTRVPTLWSTSESDQDWTRKIGLIARTPPLRARPRGHLAAAHLPGHNVARVLGARGDRRPLRGLGVGVCVSERAGCSEADAQLRDGRREAASDEGQLRFLVFAGVLSQLRLAQQRRLVRSTALSG